MYIKSVFTFLLILTIPLLAQNDFQEKILNAKRSVFPALVHIQPVKEYFSAGEKKMVQVTGSGVIISKDGLIVTNNHVAEKANFVRCMLSSKQEVEAEVIGLDPWTDLAVLKLNLEKAGIDTVPYATFGNSDDIEVGQIAIALGSPLGLVVGSSVKTGVSSS